MGVVRATRVSLECSFVSTCPLDTHIHTTCNLPISAINHTDINTQKHPFITAEFDYKHLACNHSRRKETHTHTHTHSCMHTSIPSAPRRVIHTLEEGASFPITPRRRGRGGAVCVSVHVSVCVCVFAEGAHKSPGDWADGEHYKRPISWSNRFTQPQGRTKDLPAASTFT